MLSLQQLLQVVALLLLLPQSTSLSAEACSAAQFQADNCPYYYQFNGECNADGKKCVIGSDCFDCDPCQQFRFQGCQSCTAAGCLWCSLDAVCVSTGSTVSNVSQLTCTTSDYVRRCVETPGSVFSDPFYDAMSWIYDQINVKEVWQSGITGAGIGIRINDIGVDASHPEFIGRFDTASSCELYSPVRLDSNHSHGTACAALAAAGGNDTCSVGIAPHAILSACRVIRDPYHPEGDLTPELANYSYLYVNMENMHVSSNSYGFSPCTAVKSRRSRQLQGCPFNSTALGSPCASYSSCANVDWSNPKPSAECESQISRYCKFTFANDIQACTSFLDFYVKCEFNGEDIAKVDALLKGVTEGRAGKGIVYVHSAGNDFTSGTDLNFEGILNSRLVISVGAVDKHRVHASYSESGAPLFVSAPGGDFEYLTNNVVASAGGGCGDAGVGTSYAAPVVAGVVALLLQVNPELSWRDVQGILASTSQKINPNDPSWTTNTAGLHHSYLYGFGLVDAGAAVNASKAWASSAEIQIMAQSALVNLTIPDSAGHPVVTTITVTGNDTFVAESTIVYLDLSHPSRGDLEIGLISPGGTKSILSPGQRPENTQTEERWKLMTVRNWGESASGEWTLRIADKRKGDISPCVDVLDWSTNVGNSTDPIIYDCSVFSYYALCVNGTQGPNPPLWFPGITSPNLTGKNGLTPAEACCDCGGGALASSVKDILRSWQLFVYGHDDSTRGPQFVPTTPVPMSTSGSMIPDSQATPKTPFPRSPGGPDTGTASSPVNLPTAISKPAPSSAPVPTLGVNALTFVSLWYTVFFL